MSFGTWSSFLEGMKESFLRQQYTSSHSTVNHPVTFVDPATGYWYTHANSGVILE